MSAVRTLGFVICFGVINDGTKPDHGLATLFAVLVIVALVASDRD